MEALNCNPSLTLNQVRDLYCSMCSESRVTWGLVSYSWSPHLKVQWSLPQWSSSSTLIFPEAHVCSLTRRSPAERGRACTAVALSRTMVYLPGLVMLMLMATAEARVGPSNNSSFCTESKECLLFDLVCKTAQYEVRHYDPVRWVSTDAEAYFMGVGVAMAFRRLFKYISGANEEGVMIDMTAPVLVKIPEERKMWEPAVYTLSFLLPSEYQEIPPKPTNEKVNMPEMNVYVRSYGGWMLSLTSRLHAHLLTRALDCVEASYNSSYHYGLGYDSPMKLLDRHNEIWYVAEGEPVCTVPQNLSSGCS
ncbi:heme-binding protein 2-like [Arapaima gigas]